MNDEQLERYDFQQRLKIRLQRIGRACGGGILCVVPWLACMVLATVLGLVIGTIAGVGFIWDEGRWLWRALTK